MDDDTAVDFEGLLKEARKEIDYYKGLAEEAGNVRLRETEELSRLIKELRQTGKALQASEEKYRTIIENIEEGYFEVDLKGDMVLFNEAACTILGYSREDLTGLNYREFMDEENARKVFETFNAVFSTSQRAKLSNWIIIRKDGTRRIVETPVTLIYDSDGEPCGFRGLGRDVTEKKQAEYALTRARDELEQRVEERTAELVELNAELRKQIEEREQAEERYRTLVELAPMSISIHSQERIVLINAFAVKALGASSLEELLGSCIFDLLDPELREAARQRTAWMLKEWKPAPVIEMSGKRLDGSPGWAQIHSAPILYDGRPSIMIIGLDITERKLAEDRLRESLREKEVLLREIHHRVKNNLQLMASMLELQAQSTGDNTIIETIKEAQNRIWAMAVAHETLYQSGRLDSVRSSSYLGRLLKELSFNLECGPAQIAVTQDLDDISLDLDTAINCGLILSELIVNCYKHAFPNTLDGTIIVSLKETQGNEIVLSVRDNGVGLPEGTDERNLRKFGLKLVSMLVQELGGDMDVKSQGGTEFRIIFPRTDS